METPEPVFDAPVPGSSLTAEPGGRAWKNPPQYSTVEDAIDYYVTRLSSDEAADQVVNILDMGVPVTDLANMIQTHGIMEGKHTLDVSMLVLPVLMEVIAFIGDTADIDYDMGTERDDPERADDALVRKAVLKLKQKTTSETLDGFSTEEDEDVGEISEEPMDEAEESASPSGLMARRV